MQSNKEILCINLLRTIAEDKNSTPVESLLANTLLYVIEESESPTLGNYLEEIRIALNCPTGLSIAEYANGIIIKLDRTERERDTVTNVLEQSNKTFAAVRNLLGDHKENSDHSPMDVAQRLVQEHASMKQALAAMKSEADELLEFKRTSDTLLIAAANQVRELTESHDDLLRRVNELSATYENTNPAPPTEWEVVETYKNLEPIPHKHPKLDE